MKIRRILALALFFLWTSLMPFLAQQPVPVGSGSYASFVPLSESRTAHRGGAQAYQMEHRTIYAIDSTAYPSNSWWTYALVNPWSGKLWAYPQWVELKNNIVQVGYPTYWEPTGCEMKWDTPLSITFPGLDTDHCDVVGWGDYHVVLEMRSGDKSVRVTCLHGCPVTWIETRNVEPVIANPDDTKYATLTVTGADNDSQVTAVLLLTEGVSATQLQDYVSAIPTQSHVTYSYNATASTMTTVFETDQPVLQGFLPHHYYNTTFDFALSAATYATPRGEMRMSAGQRFAITYQVHPFLPFFPAPKEDLSGYSKERMSSIAADYAAKGSFGADTYWGGKGLIQMMHYMTAALQLGDTATYRLAKTRLKAALVNWLTYTPGEKEFYFAYYPRWGAMVGFDPSYDSDTFNDHHFHYGYFVYAGAVLCMLDEDFKTQYGAMLREVARDYASWTSDDNELPEPRFRTLDMYCGHSFAGGMGNEGNGNGQESSSEAMQSWVGLWMLGAALGDQAMLEAGIFGYTLESRAVAEYWFDRDRRNIDYTKYQYPYCCNLTMQGVGWWTWFSGDPVWMHSIQWLPISPGLQNYFTEDMDFARWDYTEMWLHKEVGDYEAPTGGLGDESGLGNVCLSYLALFEPDSAARVWDRADAAGKALARNADTGGITYWLIHSLRSYGNIAHGISADYPLSAAYVLGTDTTYMVYNATSAPKTVRFSSGTTVTAPAHALWVVTPASAGKAVYSISDEPAPEPDPIAAAWTHAYPNIALHKPVEVSSYENAGCVAVNLTDGSYSTRWGSAHQDNEYAIVDLGDEYYIHYLTLYWEAAYASRMEVALSDDKVTWRTITLSSAGGVENIDLSSFNFQLSTSRARYIRLTGLERATPYGTSLYELEAYGLPLSGNADEVIALEISSDDTFLVPGETPTYAVKGYNYLGAELPVSAAITTAVTTDSYTVTATYGSLVATHSWPVMEVVHVDTITVTPAVASVPYQTTQDFKVQALDQFGFVLNEYTYTFYATDLGDTTLHFVDPSGLSAQEVTADVHVAGYADFNLAIGKPAQCSGSENENVMGAEKAVDGSLDTRWGSRFQDDEWLMIDLLDEYYLDSVKLYWEAAYATSYEVQLSSDGVTWTTAVAVTDAHGGVVTHILAENSETDNSQLSTLSARYVRILCHTRSTGYGSSLYEVEVYGSGIVHPYLPTDLEEISAFDSGVDSWGSWSPGNFQLDTAPAPCKYLYNGRIYILHNGIWYSINGQKVRF
mgnify:CR=1 FL=1